MVDVAVIAPISGLVGVGLGFVLQDLRDRRARDERREDRLWDHKRVAYEEFLATARRELSIGAEQQENNALDVEASGDAIESLDRLASRLDMYGDADIATIAHAIVARLLVFRFSTQTEAGASEKYDEMLGLIEHVTDRVRIDLGLPKRPRRSTAPA